MIKRELIKEVKRVTVHNEPDSMKLTVYSIGKTTTAGWRSGKLLPRFTGSNPARDGVYEFDFVAAPPHKNTNSLRSKLRIRDIRAYFLFREKPYDLREIVVHSHRVSMKAENRFRMPDPLAEDEVIIFRMIDMVPQRESWQDLSAKVKSAVEEIRQRKYSDDEECLEFNYSDFYTHLVVTYGCMDGRAVFFYEESSKALRYEKFRNN